MGTEYVLSSVQSVPHFERFAANFSANFSHGMKIVQSVFKTLLLQQLTMEDRICFEQCPKCPTF
jgi:hypothetical protein